MTAAGTLAHGTARKSWVAAPFPMRYSPWAELAREKVQGGALGTVSHMIYRMVMETTEGRKY